ncbi:TIGR00341 family protein [Hydrogenimonas sp.]
MDIFLIYDRTVTEEAAGRAAEAIQEAAKTEATRHLFPDTPPHYPDDALLFVMLADEAFAQWFAEVADTPVRIAMLPYDTNPLQRRRYAVPATLADAVAAGLSPETPTLSSRLLCDGEPVLGCVTIAETEWMGSGLLKRWWGLHLRPLTLRTAEERELKTAALSVEAAEEDLMTRKRPGLFKEQDNRCSRLAAAVYAPQSVTGLLKLRLLLRGLKKSADTLPDGVGTLKTGTLTILATDGRPFRVLAMGLSREAVETTLETRPTRAKILTPGLSCANIEPKESIRAQNLPLEEEMVSFYAKRNLPLVPIASESAFAELFTKLRDSSRLSLSYTLLLIVSVLMATTGLFQDSSPTIIGAMILAPLMAPIIAFSMGAIRFDATLLKRSGRTILLSTFVALAASAALAWSLPFTHVTEQMQMRTHPTLLDLAVAILAGIAAAYGYTHAKVGESLAGVAIAVALVPPLCVAGIGIGYGDMQMFANALLLYLANIVGILIASGILFYLLGYASRRYASAAFVIKLAMVALVSVPLWLSTRSLVADAAIYRAFERLDHIEVDGIEARFYLRGVVHKEGKSFAVVYVITKRGLSEKEKRELAERLRKRMPPNVHLLLSYQELYP